MKKIVLLSIYMVTLLPSFIMHAFIKVNEPVGDASLINAIRVNDLDAVRVITEGILGQESNKQECLNVGLCVAAARGYSDIVSYLLTAGAHVNPRSLNWTPLHHAVQNGSLECVKILLTAGADINGLTWWCKVSPLFIAIENDNLNMVTFLVEQGARLDIQSYWLGHTCTHAAIAANNATILDYLVSKGAPLNTPDKTDQTPLVYAAAHEKLDLVKVILLHGPAFGYADLANIEKKWLEDKNASAHKMLQLIEIRDLLSKIMR